MSDFEADLNASKTHYPFGRWAESGLEQYTSQACGAFAEIFDKLIAELGQMGAAAPEEAKLGVFESAVLALNALNATDERLIETGEREDLCELVNAIAIASRLDPSKYGGGEGPASKWREW